MNIDTEDNIILLSNGVKIDIQLNNEKNDETHDNETKKLRNITSSSAGAGSNFFHSYRKMKLIEEDRLNKMEQEYQDKKEKYEFNKKRKDRIIKYMESTNRKSEKRKRKKEKERRKKKKLNVEGKSSC